MEFGLRGQLGVLVMCHAQEGYNSERGSVRAWLMGGNSVRVIVQTARIAIQRHALVSSHDLSAGSIIRFRCQVYYTKQFTI